ncbi:hypothetical protein Nepgr_005903 [Nepenthes gracilis]|uniref:Uncharacterized protein n=1 Tax=Nepenthes gracilis TaxID=150966 RepID=A0AAD3XGU1_NEPGR|nr:hypothetical protein Nepgr_005903 [Nepenthes gracilis]
MILRPVFGLHFPFVQNPTVTTTVNTSYSINSVESDSNDHPRAHPSRFLQDLLKAIAGRQKWDLEKIRVSKLERARFSHSQRYEFGVRIGKNDLLFKFLEKLDAWERFTKEGEFKDSVKEVRSKAVLGLVELKGPFELLVLGDDHVSLQLPLNSSLTCLKQILVGEDITLEIKGAQEVSVFHASLTGLSDRSLPSGKEGHDFWPLCHSVCTPLLPDTRFRISIPYCLQNS